MVPYHPRAVGWAQGARMLDLTQMDIPFPGKRIARGPAIGSGEGTVA